MTGQLSLKQKKYEKDFQPIDKNCCCSTCQTYTRAYLHSIVTVHTVACHLLTIHNVAFQLRLMKNIRDSIKAGNFPQFVKEFFSKLYPENTYPQWIVDALKAVNISLLM